MIIEIQINILGRMRLCEKCVKIRPINSFSPQADFNFVQPCVMIYAYAHYVTTKYPSSFQDTAGRPGQN